MSVGLVLTRKIGTGFTIGDDIKIHLVSRDGNFIRIKIIAPGLPVRRDEFIDRPETQDEFENSDK